jgi:hypothetical protein
MFYKNRFWKCWCFRGSLFRLGIEIFWQDAVLPTVLEILLFKYVVVKCCFSSNETPQELANGKGKVKVKVKQSPYKPITGE